jgi:hypothetical protein
MTSKEPRRLRRERKTVKAMLALYCRHHHGGPDLCDDCSRLADYADRRLNLCPYGTKKPSCTNCPIHCYRLEERERMREVMRFAGPRMLKRHPILAVMHFVDDRRTAPALPCRTPRDADKPASNKAEDRRSQFQKNT